MLAIVRESLQPSLVTLRIADSHKQAMYEGLRGHDPWLGRCRALFLPIREICLDAISKPLAAIESLALAPIQLVGSLFFKSCSVQDSVFYLEKAVANLVDAPFSLVTAPFRYLHQVGAILFYPKEATCFRAYPGGSQESSFIRKSFQKFQNSLYPQENSPCKSPLLSRALSLPIAFVDVLADTVCPVAETAWNVCAIFQQLFGIPVSPKKHTLKGVIVAAEKAHLGVANTLAAIATSPMKLVYQTLAIFCDPTKVQSISRRSELDAIQELQKIEDGAELESYFAKMPPSYCEKIINQEYRDCIPLEKFREFTWQSLRDKLGVIFPLKDGEKPSHDAVERFQTLPVNLLRDGIMKGDLSPSWLQYAAKEQIQKLNLRGMAEKLFPANKYDRNEKNLFQTFPAEIFSNKTMFTYIRLKSSYLDNTGTLRNSEDKTICFTDKIARIECEFDKYLPFLSKEQIQNGALSSPQMRFLADRIFPEEIPPTMSEKEFTDRIQSIPVDVLIEIFNRHKFMKNYNYVSSEQYKKIDITRLRETILEDWFKNATPNDNTLEFFNRLFHKNVWEFLESKGIKIEDCWKEKFVEKLGPL
jgi:hypothetical protein